MKTNKVIFGFVGQIASGKGTAAAHIEKTCGANTYRYSTMLRDILDRVYLEQSRPNLQLLSQILRENFGQDTMARVIARDVEEDPNNIVVVEGIRRPDDIVYLKKIPGFVLVHIFADIKTRYQRLIARDENNDDQTKTYEQFKADHKEEAELKIADIAAEATEEIDNDGSFEELYAQLDALIQKYGRSN